jgi:hypothetical protein
VDAGPLDTEFPNPDTAGDPAAKFSPASSLSNVSDVTKLFDWERFERLEQEGEESMVPPPAPPVAAPVQPAGPSTENTRAPTLAQKSQTPWTPAEELRLRQMHEAGHTWAEIMKVPPAGLGTMLGSALTV